MATATRTVLFTDMSDYTGQVNRGDRNALRRLLNAHEAAVQPVLEAGGGRVVKGLGDAFLALFESATDAVRTATAAIEAAGREAGIRIRASCATGDVEEMGGDVFGGAVNLASRINARTPEGQAWFSESTRLCMNQAEIPWETVGHMRFKGIAGEVPVHRAVCPGACHLPDAIRRAHRAGTLVQISTAQTIPPLPSDPVILLRGFEPGGAELDEVLAALPLLEPHQLWLSVTTIAPSDRLAWTEAGRGLVVGALEALDAALAQVPSRPSFSSAGSNTIVFDADSMAAYDVVLDGLALPAVPLADVIAGYSYDLLPDGRWLNHSDLALLRIDVGPHGPHLRAMSAGIAVGGSHLAPGQSVRLDGPVTVQAGELRLCYHPVASPDYIGVVECPTRIRVPLGPGQLVELGREPQPPGLVLPERPGSDNLRWCTGPRAARARDQGFSIDRLLAGRRQAAVALENDHRVQVHALHPRCPTWVLDPAYGLHRVDQSCPLPNGGRVVVGTFLVGVRPPA